MKTNIKIAGAALALLLPGVANADAVAVALGASFKPVEVTTTVTSEYEGEVIIPELDVTGSGSITLPFVGTIPVTNVTGTTGASTGTVSGSETVVTTETRNLLTSVSVAAAAGELAVASAVANAQGNTGANSGAAASLNVELIAQAEAGDWGVYSSQVNVNGAPAN